ncbi:MAG: PGF-pre-PGF domain-containing protein [Nanoarchaeota archaeon]|nr:PGF-pre-PGF domain-containing protein [Nanoarchaeota archaeon]
MSTILKNKYLKSIYVGLIFVFLLINAVALASAACYEHGDQTTCENNGCDWKSDSWGSWCEEFNCWSYYTKTGCDASYVPGKNCTWQTGAGWGWCEQVSCWSFDGTDNESCEGNSAGLNCEWLGECSGYNPKTSCWDITSKATCNETSGCTWGICHELGCWKHDTPSACGDATGSSKQSCAWNSAYGYCYEQGCWDYSGTNRTACVAFGTSSGLNCAWVDNYYVHDSCEEPSCWMLDYTNATACINNSYSLNCTWDGTKYCMMQGCMNYANSDNCNNAPGCIWKQETSTGWCEEVKCWSYDGTTENECVDNAYGLSCAWDDNGKWCYYNLTSTCSSFTTESECMDTYYCWWEYNDWNTPSAGGTCKDPMTEWGAGFDTFFEEDNPGCYIFDGNSSKCNNTFGCYYNAYSQCLVNGTHANNNNITMNGLQCYMINDSNLCNNIASLGFCCDWKEGSCQQNKLSTACKDKADKFFADVGVEVCGDVAMKASDDTSAETLCNRLREEGNLPCEWNNKTATCIIKSDIFGNHTQSCYQIDNQKICVAAGCQWLKENYCEGNRSVPAGKCEQKTTAERNCKKACYGCNSKFDGSNHSSPADAEDYCYTNNPKCEFVADTTAPNGFGYCQSKGQFKNKMATDCKTDCGSCTYFGNSHADKEYSGDSKSYSTCKTPKCFCQQAYEFNNVSCKWMEDSSKAEGGYCIDKSVKTCADSCDRCYTQTDCSNTGRSSFNASGSCSWDSTDGVCSKAGETAEICWDAKDNDADNLIDCADPECYADDFCGFVQGDCFGWPDQASCEAASCSWISDHWGSWCDFPGADCWKYDGNKTECIAKNSTCDWNAGSGDGLCEQDWNIGTDCYSKMTNASCADTAGCTWTNDTFCNTDDGIGTGYCNTQGGWCDPSAFAPKNCWQYDDDSESCGTTTGCMWDSVMNACFEKGCWNYDNNQTLCGEQSNCRWSASEWQNCEIDWSSSNCWKYDDNLSGCIANTKCAWVNSTYGGGWCTNQFDTCYSYKTATECGQHTDACFWDSGSYGGGSCEGLCWNQDDISSCNALDGCKWSTGWCEMSSASSGSVDCWNYDNNKDNCNDASGCSWKSPGWCNPKGFAGGNAISGMGGGANTGTNCWQYDGNSSACTNSTLIGISCKWMSEDYPFCEADWSADCWQYDWNSSACGNASKCVWVDNYCTNVFDLCWSNSSLNSDANECNANAYCNWTVWSWGGGSCEPTCFNATSQGSCQNLAGCKWMDGWCNQPGKADMFMDMEKGAAQPIAFDMCSEAGIPNYTDICQAGFKDMGDAFGVGSNVQDFKDAGICNGEKVSMMGNDYGTGNGTVKLYVFLDTDGTQTDGCSPPDDASQVGYEFRLEYKAVWNNTLGKAAEVLNAYKCSSGSWTLTDLSINSWKEKMCSELGGPMIAVSKDGLDKYPSLYDSEEDLRIYVTTADIQHNISSPSDTAGPGWITPGSMDFNFKGIFETGIDTAIFEDFLKDGFMKYEDCYLAGDEDNDGLVNCDDWDCKFSPNCLTSGVNAATYSDTSVPTVPEIRVEEYPDSALIIFSTSKPTNGTLLFYGTDTSCAALNTTIYDIGILRSAVRNYTFNHLIRIYNDSADESLQYELDNDTKYFYRIKVCDEKNRCATSACTYLRTAETMAKCAYCNFVTQIDMPSGWNVLYDLDRDGVWEHWQGHICGPNAGMKTNYTDGMKAHIKLNNSYGGEMFFYNVTLSKSGLTSTTKDITVGGSLIYEDSLTDSSGKTIGAVGMLATTRDKIVKNLNPEVCELTIPKGTTDCTELWHCDDNGENCVERTTEASLVSSTTTTCKWKIPYCEFSMWAGGQPGTAAATAATGSSGSAGSAGGAISAKGTWAEISKDEQITFEINRNSISVKKIEFTSLKDLTDVVLQVIPLNSKPEEVLDASEKVVEYLEITKENIANEDFEGLTITFTVEKSWLADNDVADNEITLLRYTDDLWKVLPTAKIIEDEDKIKYRAESKGLSYLAIAKLPASFEEESKSTEEKEETISEEEKEQTGTDEKGKFPWLKSIIGLLLLAAIVFVVVYLLKRKKS